MASTYKAPGVYIEEITKFPPSVAAVETAIPAFIGYTEKAEKNGESLKNIPTPVTSFLEFEQYFGGPPPRNVIIRLNSSNQYVKTERQGTTYLLYDSLRLFYDNGGGECYIVSVDNYSVTPELGNMGSTPKGILGGLKALEKYDKPTLIVSPDATSIDNGLYSFQQQALLQCNKLQDRFLICDLLKNNEQTAGETLTERVDQFRGSIGINFLKYGAAYVPWLKTSLPVDLHFRDAIFAFDSQVGPTDATSLALLQSLTTNPEIQQLLFDLDNARNTVNTLKTKLQPGGPLVDVGMKDLRDQIKKLQSEFQQLFNVTTNNTIVLLAPKIQPIYLKNRQILTELRSIYLGLPAVLTSLPVPSGTQTKEFKLKSDIDNLKAQTQLTFNVLATHHKEIFVKPGAIALLTAGIPLDEAIGFLNYSPATLANVPIDAPTQEQYRVIAARKTVFDRLGVIANTAALATPTAVKNAIVAASSPTLVDLQTRIEAEITTAKAGADYTAVRTALNNRNVNATPDIDRIAVIIALAYIDEELKLLPGTTPSAQFPNSLPNVLYSTIFQDITGLKQAVETAEASGASLPATRTAGTISFPLEREYSLFAANASIDIATKFIALYESIQSTTQTYETTFEQSLLQSFGIFKTLLTKAAQELMILPPSGGIAGVYASVDNNRGVWKAPANASLNSVLAPFTIINVLDQEGLNIDPNAGKSINAIRQFNGKGTLVWGTRTLAGNDNEWKFVPVRRFFTYAEESIKKATEPFVFEPNDRNTWVRVRAMIENFLTLEWRRGALAGAKPNDAFYVKVGLGETMTAVDILEGRMIIEVGMAVVRPAEFIILRFAHKMQES